MSGGGTGGGALGLADPAVGSGASPTSGLINWGGKTDSTVLSSGLGAGGMGGKLGGDELSGLGANCEPRTPAGSIFGG